MWRILESALYGSLGLYLSLNSTMKKAIGYFLFVLSFLTWAAIATLPFFDLSMSMIAAITTTLVVVGEVAFLLSVVFLGKEFSIKVKSHLTKLRKLSFLQRQANASSLKNRSRKFRLE